jgi:hypothetical protein
MSCRSLDALVTHESSLSGHRCCVVPGPSMLVEAQMFITL